MNVYAVAKGKKTGIFNTWEECQESVKGVSGAVYKSFKGEYAITDAENFLAEFGEVSVDVRENECDFCRSHCKGDDLYEYSSWDGGIGFDYIRNIKFCPICGNVLKED